MTSVTTTQREMLQEPLQSSPQNKRPSMGGRIASMPVVRERRQSWAIGSGSLTNLFRADSRTLVRSASANFTVFSKASPLRDLAPIAHAGVSQRVMRKNTMSVHTDMVHAAFKSEADVEEDEDLAEVLGGLTSTLVLATVAACMPAMQYGFNLADMNTPAKAMRTDLGIPGEDSEYIWGICVSCLALSGIFGANAGGFLADRCGRRKALMILCLAFMMGACLNGFSKFLVRGGTAWNPGVIMFVAGRLVCGFAGGSTTVVVPKYIGEIAPPHLRGALGALFQTLQVLMMFLTQLLGLPAFMGTLEWWPAYILLLELAPGLIFLLLTPFLVESPYFAAQQTNGQELVYGILMRLRGYELNDDDLAEEADTILQPGRTSNGSKAAGFKQVWADGAARKGLIIAVFIGAAQQLSGINSVFTFSSAVLLENGVHTSIITIITIAMNAGNVVNSLLASALLDRAGRRPLLLLSASGMAISAAVLSIALSIGQTILIIASTVGFVMSFGIGMGPLPWLLPCELFSPEYSSFGVSVASTINWTANFLVALTFPFLKLALSTWVFMPNAIFLTGFVIWAARTLPETRGKTLDLIVEELAGHQNGRSKSLQDSILEQ